MRTWAVQTPAFGAALVVLYTAAVTISDAATKHLAADFEAPQILVICSATILTVIFLSNAIGGRPLVLKTRCPKPMAVRSGMTVAAAVLFFYAFALLPFAEVFLFIAMVPIFSGLMAAPVLGERVGPLSWAALVFGSLGVFMLFPAGVNDISIGHVVALAAALCGTVAIVMARSIARQEDNPLALVFYPQLAILTTMTCVAPFCWVPISGTHLALAVLCGITLFVARYALARAMRLLPAHTASTLMNLQFVWMVLVGIFVFREIPGINTVLGAIVLAASGLFLVYEQQIRASLPRKRHLA